MPNSFHNTLKLSAAGEEVIESAKQIFDAWSDEWTSNKEPTGEYFDKLNKVHICEYSLITRRGAPSDLYLQLKPLDGLTLEATYTSDMQHHDELKRWTGKGDEYETIETGLMYRKNIDHDIVECFQRCMSHLCNQRDGCEKVVKALEKYEPKYFEPIPF